MPQGSPQHEKCLFSARYNPGKPEPQFRLVMVANLQTYSLRDLTLEQVCAGLQYSPVPTGILQWDRVVYMNPAGMDLLGRDQAEEIFEYSILGWVDPLEREETRRKRINILKDHGAQIPVSLKGWMQKNGRWTKRERGTFVFEVRAWSIPLAGGDATQVTFSDITLRNQEEQSKIEAEEQLRLAVESAEIGIWDLDPKTETVRWSRRCNEIFRLAWDTDLNYSQFLKLLHPEDRVRMDRAIKESFDPAGNGDFGSDYRVLCPDGKVRWIAAKGHTFFSNVGGRRIAKRLIGTALDITELRQSDASLRESEKLAVTGRLAASIAHEINNPLASVTNLLFLLKESNLQDEQRHFIEMAQQELARVTDLTAQALRFYRDPGAPTACDLAEIADSALTLLGGKITAAQIRVERGYCHRAPVLAGREELRQVMVNLIRNSINAMVHGGVLSVRTRETTSPRTGRKGVRLTVADTGHGMNRATLRRIFEPFFTTRSAISTGLGLWLCAGIIQKYAGTIRVRSSQRPERRGTVFQIFLPLDRRR